MTTKSVLMAAATAFLLPILCLFAGIFGVVSGDGDQYYIGVGRYDVTGPAVEVEMVGDKLYIFCW